MSTTTRFQTTMKLLKDKAGLTPEAGIRNIEGWETYLKNHDAPGVKAIVADLGKLKLLLQAETIDGSKVHQLVSKLAKETVKVGLVDVPDASHIAELGEALQKESAAPAE